MPDFSLAGKNAVVTAATRGSMGHGIAIALAQQGANVAVCELAGQAEGLAETVAELRALGVKAWSTHADMTVRDEVEALFDGAVAELGSVDIAVATVGVSHFPPTTTLSHPTTSSFIRRETLHPTTLTPWSTPTPRGRRTHRASSA